MARRAPRGDAPEPLQPRHQIVAEQEAVERLDRRRIDDRIAPDRVAVPAHLRPDALDRLKAGPLVPRVQLVARPEREILEHLALRWIHRRDRAPEREGAEVRS